MAGEAECGRQLRTYKVLWPPTVNHLYTVARGRKILSTVGRRWKKTALEELWLQRPVSGPNPASITIELYPPDRRGFDVDNRIKAVLDLFKQCAILIEDDCFHVPRVLIEYIERANKRPGYALVEVGPYEPSPKRLQSPA